MLVQIFHCILKACRSNLAFAFVLSEKGFVSDPTEVEKVNSKNTGKAAWIIMLV